MGVFQFFLALLGCFSKSATTVCAVFTTEAPTMISYGNASGGKVEKLSVPTLSKTFAI